ncbi:MAG: DUF11 domain-containing protein, partial [Methanotrichaceae archaeon]|nr:DUF11 domain-containing protein [Methanotrichaceae archaeon]
EGTATFEVTASGSGPFSYQWYKDGVELNDGGHVSGSKTSKLIISPVEESDEGDYHVLVKGSCGEVASNLATLKVKERPTVTDPEPQEVCEGGVAVFEVTATGTGPLTYQWYKDGEPLTDGGHVSGSKTSKLIISPVEESDEGEYSVVVTGPCGPSDPSAEVKLTALDSPTIITQPLSQTAQQGETVTFSVEVSCEEPLTYQWQKDGVDLVDIPGRVQGSLTDTLTLTGAKKEDEGSYGVIVSCRSGCHATSLPANLIINPSGPDIISVTTAPVDPCIGKAATVSASVTDQDCDVETVLIVYNNENHPMQLESGDRCSGSWIGIIPSPAAPLELDFYVLARDSLGNEVRSPADQTQYHVKWVICDPLEVLKTASSSEVSPGGEVTYTITVNSNIALSDVVITENYPSGTTFISASREPDSGTNNVWTIGNLPAGNPSLVITVTLRAPEDPNIIFNFNQSAKGTGFVRTYKDMSTGRESYPLQNVVTITSNELPPASATSYVSISGQPGTKVSMRESGSGDYTREELLYLYKDNRSIKDQSNLSASYQPTSFQLPGDRSLDYNSQWTEAECAKNYITSESVTEEYRYVNEINRDSLLFADINQTRLEVEADFQGTRHASYLKLSPPDEMGKRETLMELSSDYSGSFQVREKIGTTFRNRSDAITYVKYYDQPHVTIYQASAVDRTDENNLNYTITILNDGNRSMGPIRIRDVFPVGTFFFDASTKPSFPPEEDLIDAPFANWTFTSLARGQAVTVYLRVKIYQVLDVPVNWVYVSAGYDGNWFLAENSSASNYNWLSCSPQGVCTKTEAGWKPPDWGFDRTEDICEACVNYVPAPPQAAGTSSCASCNVGT